MEFTTQQLCAIYSLATMMIMSATYDANNDKPAKPNNEQKYKLRDAVIGLFNRLNDDIFEKWKAFDKDSTYSIVKSMNNEQKSLVSTLIKSIMMMTEPMLSDYEAKINCVIHNECEMPDLHPDEIAKVQGLYPNIKWDSWQY
ncbi:MAG: hypothetical protein J6S84_08180 [Bacteroidales bacterium]|nr:hypothetical protein [Bacteroidales bacterium]